MSEAYYYEKTMYFFQDTYALQGCFYVMIVYNFNFFTPAKQN